MKVLKLFEGFGVELEYMIVHRDTLDVMPVADLLLRDADGAVVAELERNSIAWCNELVAHVIELKTNGPAQELASLAHKFACEIKYINDLLKPHHAMLLPTAMHPWMNPDAEMMLWDHEYNEIYEAFNRIFDCRGHGWSNLQSTHINLPFSNDDEFGRLHAAIRAILPLLPAVASSSPIMEGRVTGVMDTRMEVYKTNARSVPQVSGLVVPEPVFSKQAYEQELLESVYEAIRPYDTEGILQEEWLNARGAIARFDRNAIEIRVLDIQECPAMDLAIVESVVAVLIYLTRRSEGFVEQTKALSTEYLASVLSASIRNGRQERTELRELSTALGIEQKGVLSPFALWMLLVEKAVQEGAVLTSSSSKLLQLIATEGSLSERILRETGSSPDRDTLKRVYRKLSHCLVENIPFVPETYGH